MPHISGYKSKWKICSVHYSILVLLSDFEFSSLLSLTFIWQKGTFLFCMISNEFNKYLYHFQKYIKTLLNQICFSFYLESTASKVKFLSLPPIHNTLIIMGDSDKNFKVSKWWTGADMIKYEQWTHNPVSIKKHCPMTYCFVP